MMPTSSTTVAVPPVALNLVITPRNTFIEAIHSGQHELHVSALNGVDLAPTSRKFEILGPLSGIYLKRCDSELTQHKAISSNIKIEARS